jgi:hypothetical protein
MYNSQCRCTKLHFEETQHFSLFGSCVIPSRRVDGGNWPCWETCSGSESHGFLDLKVTWELFGKGCAIFDF